MENNDLSKLFTNSIRNLEPLFHRQLFYCFGREKNHDQFLRLADCITPSIVRKTRRNLTDLEAILFGQAGLLPGVPVDGYSADLLYRFTNFRYKYSLEPMNQEDWIFKPLEGNPTLRIGQLAILLHKEQQLFEKCLDNRVGVDELRASLRVNASEYWDNHFQFGVEGLKCQKQMDRVVIESILTRVVNPVRELKRIGT